MDMARLSLLILLLLAGQGAGACQSCLVNLTTSGLFGSRATRGRHHHHAQQKPVMQSNILPLGLLTAKSAAIGTAGSSVLSNGAIHQAILRLIDNPAIRFLALRKLLSVAHHELRAPFSTEAINIHNLCSAHTKRRWAGGLFLELSENGDSGEGGEVNDKAADESADSKDGNDSEEMMSGGMIAAIGFYKGWISPLLPPACRFLPTCSQYGVQAIKEFGPTKGLILTAWRLARCSPLGGKGYDPPKWPPVPYTYGSY